MGTYYTTYLYFHIDNLEVTLTRLNDLTALCSDWQGTIHLPNDKQVKIAFMLVNEKKPFDFHFECDELYFDISLPIPLNNKFTQEYIEKQYTTIRSIKDIFGVKTEYSCIGLIMVGIVLGRKYFELNFTSVVRSQNDFMVESPPFHWLMKQLVMQGQGILGLIDKKSGPQNYFERYHLEAPEKRFLINVEQSNYGKNIDYIVETLQEQLDKE